MAFSTLAAASRRTVTAPLRIVRRSGAELDVELAKVIRVEGPRTSGRTRRRITKGSKCRLHI